MSNTIEVYNHYNLDKKTQPVSKSMAEHAWKRYKEENDMDGYPLSELEKMKEFFDLE